MLSSAHKIQMAHKFKTFLVVVAHTILSFVAALVAGFTFYTFFRPLMGHERYGVVAKSSIMLVLLLIVVALWGVLLYARWYDHRAFFAWVLPALWTCHLILSRGLAAIHESRGDALFFLEIGAAYSIGSVLAAIVTGPFSARAEVS